MVTSFHGAEVGLRDYGEFEKGQCRLQFKGFYLDCKSGDSQTVKKISFPYCTSILYCEILGHNVENMDNFDAYFQIIQDSGKAGIVTENYISGKLKTSPIFITLLPGDTIRIDGENYTVKTHTQGETEDELEFFETFSSNPQKDDEIYFRQYICKDFNLRKDTLLDFGKVSFGSKKLCVTMEIVIEYNHIIQLTEDKKIPFIFGLYYGCEI